MTQEQYETDLTPEQRKGLLELFGRRPLTIGLTGEPMKWERFLHSAQAPAGPVFPYVFVPWCGMWVGIERDGHTHT